MSNLTFRHVFVTLIYFEVIEKVLKYKYVNDTKCEEME